MVFPPPPQSRNDVVIVDYIVCGSRVVKCSRCLPIIHHFCPLIVLSQAMEFCNRFSVDIPRFIRLSPGLLGREAVVNAPPPPPSPICYSLQCCPKGHPALFQFLLFLRSFSMSLLTETCPINFIHLLHEQPFGSS